MMVRLVKPDDERALKRLIMRYLKETYENGGDFPPTLDNAAVFAQQAIQGAQEGDPCLVADVDGAIVGFVMARGVHFPGMTTRDKTIRSWGSYVLPEHRRNGYTVSMWMILGRLARQAGYTRLLGTTHGSDYAENSLRAVKAIAGLREVGKVLVVDLAKRDVKTDTPEVLPA